MFSRFCTMSVLHGRGGGMGGGIIVIFALYGICAIVQGLFLMSSFSFLKAHQYVEQSEDSYLPFDFTDNICRSAGVYNHNL